LEIPTRFYPPGGHARESWRSLFYANLIRDFIDEIESGGGRNQGNFEDGAWGQEGINAVELSFHQRRWGDPPLPVVADSTCALLRHRCSQRGWTISSPPTTDDARSMPRSSACTTTTTCCRMCPSRAWPRRSVIPSGCCGVCWIFRRNRWMRLNVWIGSWPKASC